MIHYKIRGSQSESPFALSDQSILVNGAAVVVLAQEERCVLCAVYVRGRVCRPTLHRLAAPTQTQANCSNALTYITAASSGM